MQSRRSYGAGGRTNLYSVHYDTEIHGERFNMLALKVSDRRAFVCSFSYQAEKEIGRSSIRRLKFSSLQLLFLPRRFLIA
jgi:hypothetical protein